VIIMSVIRNRRIMGRTIAGTLAAAAGRYIVNRARQRLQTNLGMSRSRTQLNRRTVRGGNYVTQQHDARRVYRKKNMPRRQKKRWLAFKRKVKAVDKDHMGTNVAVMNDSDVLIATNGSQVVGSVCLYGLTGQSGFPNGVGALMGQNDLARIRTQTPLTDADKIEFRSGVLDITARNTGEDQIECDVYEYSWKKFENSGSASGALNNGFVAANQLGANKVFVDTRGSTPFQCPEGMSYLKIWKKTKFFVPVDGTFTYQMRNPKNWVWDAGDVTRAGDGTSEQHRRCRGLLIYVKGVPVQPSAPEDPPPVWPIARLTVGCTRTYTWKQEGEKDNASGVM